MRSAVATLEGERALVGIPTQRLVDAVDAVVLAVHATAEARGANIKRRALAALNCWLYFAAGVSARDIASETVLDVPVVLALIDGADEARADSADVASWLDDLLALVVVRAATGFEVRP